jgi:Mrr N-terminal domain
MAVPGYQSLMGPLLDAVADGEAHRMKNLREQLAPRLGLTEEDLRATIPSGAGLFANRLHWAATYMGQAGLVGRLLGNSFLLRCSLGLAPQPSLRRALLILVAVPCLGACQDGQPALQDHFLDRAADLPGGVRVKAQPNG